MNSDSSRSSIVAHSEVIDILIGRLHEHYVFPTVVEEMALALRQRQHNGVYTAISDGEELARTLTEHLQEVSRDKHLAVFSIDAEAGRRADEESSELSENARDVGALFNYGFEKVERLAGNIGYLSLHTFFSPSVAVRAVITAMDFIAHTNTLIVDLRASAGGELSMVNFLASYFFSPEPVHLNNIYWRATDSTQQIWTLPYIPGQRYVDKPIYILTSRATPAAAEEFAYDLQSQKRAVVIGETTAGEANPLEKFWITDQFGCWIPVRQSINPMTGTSWEGTGVIPDIEVAREDAFKTAYSLALKQRLESTCETATVTSKYLMKEVKEALVGLEYYRS